MKEHNATTDRRGFLGSVSKTVSGAVVLGTVVGGGSIASTVSADRGPDPEDPHDDVIEDIIENPHDGSDFAEIHSVATGAKRVDDQIGGANVAISVPITYGDEPPGSMYRAKNVMVNVEPRDSIPGDYDLQNIVTHEQGDDGGDLEDVVQYALDAAWSGTVGRVFPAPSPMSVESTNGPNISQDYNETTIEADFGRILGEDVITIRWEVDFYVDGSGTVPHGGWVWDVTIEGDVGNYSTGAINPGFNKYGDFSHTHAVAISVQDYD